MCIQNQHWNFALFNLGFIQVSLGHNPVSVKSSEMIYAASKLINFDIKISGLIVQ